MQRLSRLIPSLRVSHLVAGLIHRPSGSQPRLEFICTVVAHEIRRRDRKPAIVSPHQPGPTAPNVGWLQKVPR
jgi:hypothetical protein